MDVEHLNNTNSNSYTELWLSFAGQSLRYCFVEFHTMAEAQYWMEQNQVWLKKNTPANTVISAAPLDSLSTPSQRQMFSCTFCRVSYSDITVCRWILYRARWHSGENTLWACTTRHHDAATCRPVCRRRLFLILQRRRTGHASRFVWIPSNQESAFLVLNLRHACFAVLLGTVKK